MKGSLNSYATEEIRSLDDVKFLFCSRGRREIIKVIQYSFICEISGRKVFNLGFGDYDPITDMVSDTVCTNNGDSYQVFNTVLASVPQFFHSFNNAALMIQGSDSRSDFPVECRKTCARNCGTKCRKLDQRIKIYCAFINANYDSLTLDYQFRGDTGDDEEQFPLETYVVGKEYKRVFCFKNA